MLYILIAILVGIFLAINFKLLESLFFICTIFLFLFLIPKSKFKYKKIKTGRFINFKNIEREGINIDIKKVFAIFIVLVIFFTYSLLKVEAFDNKYETSNMSGKFIIISKDESSEYYNKYISKNSNRR